MTQANSDFNRLDPNDANGSSALAPSDASTPAIAGEDLSIYDRSFDQPVILRQSPMWPQIIIWMLLAVVTFGFGWSYFAKIEQVVQATGQLKPQGRVKEVQAPMDGVIEAVMVDDGETVEQGDVLMRFDSTTANARLTSLNQIKDSLEVENRFYEKLIGSENGTIAGIEAAIAQLDLPPEIALLARNRAALIEENRLYRAQMGMGSLDGSLGFDEQERLRASVEEANTRSSAARLELEQLREQLDGINVRLDDARIQLETEKEILAELNPLLEEGAVARLQFVRQKQQVQTRNAEVAQLQEEKRRIELDIQQAQEELRNTEATTHKNTFDLIARNKNQVAQIDSQFSKVILENKQRISEIESQISQTQQELRYQELRAPISGTVFDMQAGPGFVTNPTEMLLKIVPQEDLVAEVFITQQDIGFIQPGMEVDVRIDTYTFSEFGDIKGEIIWIGDDALEPNETYNFFRYPARIRLSSQSLDVGERNLPIQSGMSISANIKIREDRRVISLFLERFTSEVESLKEVR